MESSTSARKILAAERMARAVELRKQHKTYVEIGIELGVTGPAAYKLVMKAMKRFAEISDSHIPELREVERDRIDGLFEIVRPLLTNDDPVVQLRAVDSATKLSGRMAALYGLDGPKKIEGNIQVNSWSEVLARAKEAEKK